MCFNVYLSVQVLLSTENIFKQFGPRSGTWYFYKLFANEWTLWWWVSPRNYAAPSPRPPQKKMQVFETFLISFVYFTDYRYPVLSNLYHLPMVLHLIIKFGGYKNREYLVLVFLYRKLWLFSTMVENILICPENLLQKRKCSIFHTIFKIHDISNASKGVIME